MSAEDQKDVGSGAVSMMMGVALGIPLCIIGGLIVQQTGWGLIIGPFVGLGIGVVLAMFGRGSGSDAPSAS